MRVRPALASIVLWGALSAVPAAAEIVPFLDLQPKLTARVIRPTVETEPIRLPETSSYILLAMVGAVFVAGKLVRDHRNAAAARDEADHEID